MSSGKAELFIVQVGFTGSDADRERLLAMKLWLDLNDPTLSSDLDGARASAQIHEDIFDLNLRPPRDFLSENHSADIVVLHNLWGVPGVGRGTGTTAHSPLHETGLWGRRLAATAARYVFAFGRDIDATPTGYQCVGDSPIYHLTVWSQIEMRRRKSFTLHELAEARLTCLTEMMANEVLDLSHVSHIGGDDFALIASMPNLQQLLLSGITAEDAGIAAMLDAGCHGLRSLYLDETRVGRLSLQALSACSELTLLSLNDTVVGGAALAHLRDMPCLETLSVVNTDLSDEDLEALLTLKNLRLLALTGSRVSRRGVNMLSRALTQCSVEMADALAP